MFAILVLLGILSIFFGAIVYIIGGFRESVIWGLILLFLPLLLSIVGVVLGGLLGMSESTWWLATVSFVPLLPWLVFLFMHWEKAKNGFLMGVAGLVFFAAAGVTMTPETKQQLAAAAVASAAKSGQPLPPALADLLGIKPPATTAKGAVPGTAAAAPAGAGKVDPAAPLAKPPIATDPALAALPVAQANLETEAQVGAALAEINDRSRKLMARKEALRNSPDQPALFALAEDIKAFNERLKFVTARQSELNAGKPGASSPGPTPAATPVAPSAAPAIPPTVVIPASTPAPPQKK